MQKPSRGVLIKRCSENMQHFTLMPKCGLNKVAKQCVKIHFFNCLFSVPNAISPDPHISFKYARHNHLRCPMMRKVSLEM